MTKYECKACREPCRLEVTGLTYAEDIKIRESCCILLNEEERRHPAKWIKIEDVKE